jgi:hypothetical protein
MAEATEARRGDLQARLSDARRLLQDTMVRVQVVGDRWQGKSALIEAMSLSERQDIPARNPATTVRLASAEARFPAADGGPARSQGWNPAQVHAVLFVSDSSAPLTTPEIEQLRHIVDLCPITAFVQTKIDEYGNWHAVLERNMALIADAGIGVEAWAVSSVGRLRAEQTGDAQLGQSSGIPALRGELERMCTDFDATSLRVVAHHTLAVLTELRQMLLTRRAELADPSDVEQIRRRATAIDKNVSALRDRAVRWPALLANGFASMHADTAYDLRRRVDGVRTHLDEAISDRGPLQDWEEVTYWLRHRMTLEAQHNTGFAVTSTQGFSARAAQHFGLGQAHAVDPSRACPSPEMPPPPSVDELPDNPAVTLSAGMNLLMRAWMGFMMYYLIAGIAHADLSPLLGLIPAGVLSLTAVIEERKHWVARGRSQAAGALHKYVDMASVKASNDASEALRQLEQQLRESYGTHIDREETALGQAHRKAQTSLTDLEAAPELVTKIDSGLAYYEELGLRASRLVAAHLMDNATHAQAPTSNG